MLRKTLITENVEGELRKQHQLESIDVSHFTLEERVRIIEAYDKNPIYSRVSKLFNCKWEQVKKIVSNREVIMKLYREMKNTESQEDSNQDDIRQREISLLGDCMYEYLQRAQCHSTVNLTEKLIRMKALEFCNKIQIENFTPNRAWINKFKETFHLTSFKDKIQSNRTPPSTLDFTDIMTYCTKHKTEIEENNIREYITQNSIMNYKAIFDLRQKDFNYKINLLELALYEYMQRVQYEEREPLADEQLQDTAYDFKDILQMPIFDPNAFWLNRFKDRFNLHRTQRITTMSHRIPPKSLNLEEILVYCSRPENENQIIAPVKLTSPRKRSIAATTQKQTGTRTASVVAMEIDEIQVPNTRKHPNRTCQNLPIYINEKNLGLDEQNVAPYLRAPLRYADFQPSPLKKQKIVSADIKTNQRVQRLKRKADEEEQPKQIQNCEEALKLLASLKEFPVLKANYRSVYLISQLEAILTTQQNFEVN